MSLAELFHQETGPLTRELLRQPGRFGLGQVPADLRPDAVTDMVCGFCATGCGLRVHLQDGQAVNLTPTTDYPVNLGMACPKGWEALRVLDSPERAAVPLLRDAQGRQRPVDWDTALTQFVRRFQAIQQEHGPEAVAFLSTGQMVTEELAFLGALAKFGMGMRHGDGNTRQCMASAVTAYKESFGFDAPPYTYADLEESDVIVLVGSNLCIAHPILWERVMRNRHQPQIIVVDPRMTETAMNATLHVRPKPKSDLALFYGIARILIETGRVDREFIAASTRDFEAFAEFTAEFSEERVVEETGVDADVLHRMADMICPGQRVSFWWTMGVNQSHQGVRTAQALINLALMTGSIGRPGTGANSITGQCNAMGSRLFSNTTALPGGHDFRNPRHRQKIADILGIDVKRIPEDSGLPYHRILEEILRGRIRGLWVVCTNPAHSWINQMQCRDILDRLDFLVVQDMYHTTETARLAHLVLPAAGWGEKDGTFINSERRVGVVRQVRRAPGQALSDFRIFRLIAQRWGCADLFSSWTSPAAVFEILKRCTQGQPCDITGIGTYDDLEAAGGIQWPAPEASGRPERERRLYTDGRFFHDDRRARFVWARPEPLPERPGGRFPLLLMTGRGSAAQWHTQTRTRQSSVLRRLALRDSVVEVSPTDAAALNIATGDQIEVISQRGRVRARAVLTHAVRPGEVFMPMHDEGVNRLTYAAFDPHSSQPAYKACAVRIARMT